MLLCIMTACQRRILGVTCCHAWIIQRQCQGVSTASCNCITPRVSGHSGVRAEQ